MTASVASAADRKHSSKVLPEATKPTSAVGASSRNRYDNGGSAFHIPDRREARHRLTQPGAGGGGNHCIDVFVCRARFLRQAAVGHRANVDAALREVVLELFAAELL